MQRPHLSGMRRGWSVAVRAVERVSLVLGGVRWAFMPVGLLALVAVGVHAAADRVDDPLRLLLQGADAALDAVWGTFSATEAWVDAVGERGCTRVARALALGWELAVALLMGLPLLGYSEEASPGPLVDVLRQRWGELARGALRRPTLLRLARPLAAACFVLAGLVGLGQMLQASLFQGLTGLLGAGAALFLARVAALGAMAAVAASLGGRAVLRHLQHADAVSERDEGRPVLARVLHGLPGTVVLLPLAAAALVATAPLLGFFR